MSVKVTVKQLQQHLPEILKRTVADDDVCVIEKNGKGIAVIVSLREWKRQTIGTRLDALGNEYRVAPEKQQRTEELLAHERLQEAEKQELEALLNEADEIMLRRAQALEKR